MTKQLDQSPALLTTSKPWQFFGRSRAWWKRLEAAKRTPPAIDFGLPSARPTWRISDLTRWLDSLKPDRTVRRGPPRKAKSETAAE